MELVEFLRSQGSHRDLNVSSAWQPVGAAMGIFDHALQYVKQRKQFGVPIASFQLVQERLQNAWNYSINDLGFLESQSSL
jgi:O-antigen ligase